MMQIEIFQTGFPQKTDYSITYRRVFVICLSNNYATIKYLVDLKYVEYLLFGL